jgi:phospholipid/cholesterol/gamma-HCH transport system permease protein
MPLGRPARVMAMPRMPKAPGFPSFVTEVGAMFALTVTALSRAVRRPVSYGPEFIEQFRFVLAVAWFPMILTSFAIAFGPFGIQGSDFLGLFGALDRLGGRTGHLSHENSGLSWWRLS